MSFLTRIPRRFSAFWLSLFLIILGPVITPYMSSGFSQLAYSAFTSWRPYNNPNRLISVGMNKGEVLAIAGKPDYEESYYQSSGGRLIRISDWYYNQTGFDAQTTILKFAEESLVSITTNLTR